MKGRIGVGAYARHFSAQRFWVYYARKRVPTSDPDPRGCDVLVVARARTCKLSNLVVGNAHNGMQHSIPYHSRCEPEHPKLQPNHHGDPMSSMLSQSAHHGRRRELACARKCGTTSQTEQSFHAGAVTD
eukprot:3798809-Pyramimonas_sp.AAC.1